MWVCRSAAGVRRLAVGVNPKLAEATRQEYGNISFDVYRQIDDERSVVILERYASQDAFADHQASDHFRQSALERIVPSLDKRWLEEYADTPAD
ncbi:putative quinol monooxygenase [Streptomyces sp. NPDC059466]|uniref:putative quinol monooxygenase n=1 Tax=unclassified Streptomyces TaxID=2593676 RepID=UPI0036A74E93